MQIPPASLRVGMLLTWIWSVRIRVDPWRRSSRARAPAPHYTASRDGSHAVVVRSTAALGRDPGDDLIRIGDVARLAVHAIRRVQADALAVGLGRVVDHFIDVGGTEVLARAAEFFHATRVADVGVVDHQMRWLIFFVLRSGVIKVGQLIECELAVPFGGTEQAG